MSEESPLISDNSEINDIRTGPEFKGITLSGYKKTEVKKQLVDSIKGKNIEAACNWCAELVCAGHYLDVWEIFLAYTGK